MTYAIEDGKHTYGAHVVTLTPDWQFTVTGPEFADDTQTIIFSSLKAARDEIQKRVADSEKLKAQNTSFSLRVITDTGDAVTIDRINRTSGYVADITTKYMYPADSTLLKLLRQRIELRAELSKVEQALAPFRMSTGRSYGRISADDYGRVVARLVDEHTKLTAALEAQKEKEKADA